jgi:hypothetical protein
MMSSEFVRIALAIAHVLVCLAILWVCVYRANETVRYGNPATLIRFTGIGSTCIPVCVAAFWMDSWASAIGLAFSFSVCLSLYIDRWPPVLPGFGPKKGINGNDRHE